MRTVSYLIVPKYDRIDKVCVNLGVPVFYFYRLNILERVIMPRGRNRDVVERQ